jgi:hypothetical protein
MDDDEEKETRPYTALPIPSPYTIIHLDRFLVVTGGSRAATIA